MQRGRVETRFTRLVGCDLPLQLAVLGGIGTTELAAEVAAAGGLGMVPGGVALPDSSVGSTGAGFLMPFTPPSDGGRMRLRRRSGSRGGRSRTRGDAAQ